MADDFLAYLEKRESHEATEELLNIPNFREDYEEAMQEIERGNIVLFKSI